MEITCPFWAQDIRELPPEFVADFDFIWASPPCQRWSVGSFIQGDQAQHPNLIPLIRELAGAIPYAIENVRRAPIRPDIRLTGKTVGLPQIERLRHIECTWPVLLQAPLQHVTRQ